MIFCLLFRNFKNVCFIFWICCFIFVCDYSILFYCIVWLFCFAFCRGGLNRSVTVWACILPTKVDKWKIKLMSKGVHIPEQLLHSAVQSRQEATGGRAGVRACVRACGMAGGRAGVGVWIGRRLVFFVVYHW